MVISSDEECGREKAGGHRNEDLGIRECRTAGSSPAVSPRASRRQSRDNLRGSLHFGLPGHQSNNAVFSSRESIAAIRRKSSFQGPSMAERTTTQRNVSTPKSCRRTDHKETGVRLSAMRHSTITMSKMQINSEKVYTCDHSTEETKKVLQFEENESDRDDSEFSSEFPKKMIGRARQFSPTRKTLAGGRETTMRRPTNHTDISEQEVLASKYLISFDSCFPNKKNRRCSDIEIEVFKSELNASISQTEENGERQSVLTRLGDKSNLFLTEIDEEDNSEEARQKRFMKQRRENLLREVWEKQYQHNMQSFDEAVIQVADNLACSGNMKLVKKAILLNPMHKGYYIREAELRRRNKDYNCALRTLTHIINTLDNSQIEESQEIQAQIMSYTAEWAEQYFDKQCYDQALDLFTEIINNRYCSEALHLATQLRVAECLLAKNDRRKAMELLNYLCSRWPKRSDLFLMRSRLHGKSLNASAQFHDVKRAIAVGPKNVQALEYYNELEDKSQGLYEEALRLTTSSQFWSAHQKVSLAIQIVPDKIEFYLLRGMLKRCVGEFMSAIDDLESVIGWACGFEEDELQATRVDEAKYQIMLTLNDFACEVAKFDLDQALNIISSIIDRQEEQQRKDAQRAHNDVVPNQSNASDATSGRSLTPDKAVAILPTIEEGITAGSNTISTQIALQNAKSPAALPLHVYANRASVYTKLGHYKEALVDYEYAFQHIDHNSSSSKNLQVQIASIRSKLGDAAYKTSDYEKAHNEYSQAINWDENCVVYYIRRSHTRYMMRQLELAKSDLKRATALYEISLNMPLTPPGRKPSKTELYERQAMLAEINKLSLVLIGKEYKHKGTTPTSLTNFRLRV